MTGSLLVFKVLDQMSACPGKAQVPSVSKSGWGQRRGLAGVGAVTSSTHSVAVESLLGASLATVFIIWGEEGQTLNLLNTRSTSNRLFF